MSTVFFTTITDEDSGNEDTFVNQTLEGALRTVLETLFDEWTIEVSNLETVKEKIREAFAKPDRSLYDGRKSSVSMHIDIPQFDETGRMYRSPQLGCKFTTIERTLGE